MARALVEFRDRGERGWVGAIVGLPGIQQTLTPWCFLEVASIVTNADMIREGRPKR